MGNLNLTAKEINQSVPKKLKLVNLTDKRERHGEFWLDGKYQFKVTLPNIHGGSGSVTPLWLKCCRDTVFLGSSEYADLVRCPMTGEKYERLIRERFPKLQESDEA